MKCQEVVERMHRYIDHDLNELEKEQLLAHVKTCKNCSEKFEVLQKLSQDLEKLPDVSPPFSLVDRIMPQLDEIDKGRKEQGSTIQEMKKEDHVLPLSERSGSSSRSFMKTRMGRIFMGTAAAAVVLGVAVYQFQPEQLDQAEIDNSYTTNELGQADPYAVTGSGGGTELKEDMISPEPSEEKPASPQTRSAEVPDTNTSTSSNTDASEPAIASEPETNPGQSGTGTNKTEPGAPLDSNTVTPKKEITSNKTESSISSGKEKEPSVTSPAKPEPNSGTSNNKAGDTNSEAKGQAGDRATAPETPMETLPPVSDSGIESITSDPSISSNDNTIMGTQNVEDKSFPGLVTSVSPKWLSPDGQYWVDYKDKKVSIYQLDGSKKDQKKLLHEIEIKGTYVKGSWTEDSLTYNYEVQVDGKSTKYSYTLTKEDQKSEVKREEKNTILPVPQTETQSVDNKQQAPSEPSSK